MQEDLDRAGVTGDLQGKRFVVSGLSRLTVRVATALRARGADVTVVASGTHQMARELDGVRLVETAGDRETAFQQAGIESAASVLALADDDLDNLAAVVLVGAMAPDVPVVLRTFDVTLADQHERGLHVRRAYSVSALAAPAFVAAAAQADVVETLSLGESQVPLCRLRAKDGALLTGLSPSDLSERFGCQLLAVGRDGTWAIPTAGPGEDIRAGDEVMVGGPMERVLRLALGNEHLFEPAPRSAWRLWIRRSRPGKRPKRESPSFSASATLLPVAAAVLGLILLVSVVVFAVALHKNPIDALYFAVTTALGNSTLDERGGWLKIFGVGAMVAGGALLGVLFSYLASVATAHRLEERMGRQAQRLAGHAVVAGLGTVGYRVARLLVDLGIPCSAMDLSPNPRFLGALGEHTPVLTGDVRLPENLTRAGITEAVCLFAMTDDDLTNIEACLQAQRLRPGIRTIARVYDEALAARMRDAFGIEAISATRVTAASFVGAAVDERAARTIAVGPLEFHAYRHDVTTMVTAEDLAALAGRGVHVLAVRRGSGSRAADPSAVLPGGGASAPLRPGDSVILAGPPEELRTARI